MQKVVEKFDSCVRSKLKKRFTSTRSIWSENGQILNYPRNFSAVLNILDIFNVLECFGMFYNTLNVLGRFECFVNLLWHAGVGNRKFD